MSDVTRRLAALSPEKRELMRLRLQRQQRGQPPAEDRPVAHPDSYPLTYEQERLWFLEQLVPGHASYVAAAARLTGPLQVAALEQSLDEILRRHDALRTRVVSTGGRPSQVTQEAQSLPLPLIDLRGRPEPGEKEALRIAAREMERPFDLAEGPLVRVMLFRLGAEDHLLFAAAHHIVCDGWSLGVFMRELGVLYLAFAAGRRPRLPACPLKYREFVRWQRERIERERAAQLEYWKSTLAHSPDGLDLATDYPRPVRPGLMGERRPVDVPASLLRALREVGQRGQATLFMVLLAAFDILLHRCSGQEDIIVGCPTSGRLRAETEGMIGFFANTLPLRSDLSGDPRFVDLLGRVREATLGAYAHQDVPFAKVVEVARPRRRMTSPPLFDVVFSHLPPFSPPEIPGLTVTPVPIDRQPLDFDLALIMEERADGLCGSLFYGIDLFRAETAAELARSYALILDQCVACPETRLSAFLLTPDLDAAPAVIARRRGTPTIAMASTFVAEPVEPALAFWLRELNMPRRIEFAPIDQVLQQLLDPSSLLATNRDGVNVLLVRLEDLQAPELAQGASDAGAGGPKPHIGEGVRTFALALKAAVDRSGAPHLVVVCPGSDALDAADGGRAADQLAELRSLTGVHLVTAEELATTYPVARCCNPSGEALARVPFTPVFFAALGTMLARKIHALGSSVPKVLVLDCDHTLWKGICGEDGPSGVELDAARLAVQEFAVAQHDAGTLVCLCSTNNEQDVIEVFEHRPHMPLRRDHLASWRINWRPKSENLQSLADELGLGLDTFVYIDDDPAASAEVAARCPEVLALPLPQDPDAIHGFLKHLWFFDRLQITDEDRQRTTLHQHAALRERLRREVPSLEAFLETLAVEIQISRLGLEHVARAAQLSQRTNQFNVTTIRRSDSELRRLLLLGSLEGLVVKVRDRFGDYGLTGLILFECGLDTLRVDTFLLSCRVLGRRVEHQMLRELGRIASGRGLDRIEVPCVATSKNGPALNFLEAVGGEFKRSAPTGTVFAFSAGAVMTASDRCGPAPGRDSLHSVSHDSATGRARAAHVSASLWRRVAGELTDAEQILRAIESERAWYPRPDLPSRFTPPQTTTERRLAELWSELLRVERVGVDDDFFEMGGHSLLAVELVSRINDAWQSNLTLLQFFAAPAIRAIARTLDDAGEHTSSAETRIDRASEVVLAPEIRPPDAEVPAAATPRHIFLTGATGFLGSYVLDELLQQTNADIYCLVRCANPEEGQERIRAALRSYGLGSATSRVVAIPGDLAQPMLGLGVERFDRLASAIDVIYHVGGLVNFLYPYSLLRPTNVAGTHEVLRLAARSRAKPVHYVSTLGILSRPPHSSFPRIGEGDSPDDWTGLRQGYLQSKWVAEKLVQIARDRGLPGAIFRPGLVTGDSRTGAWQAGDFLRRVIRSCIELGAAPDLDVTLGLTPVDYVGRAIVHLSRAATSNSKVFHLIQPQVVPWKQIVEWIRECGIALRRVSVDDWRASLETAGSGIGRHAVDALLAEFGVAPGASGDLANRAHAMGWQYDDRNTREGLAGSAITCPPIDAQLVRRYLLGLGGEDGSRTRHASHH